VILAAGLLVLLGLGLFVAGILTGVTALYWGCVAACVVAAVLLVLARRQLSSSSGVRTPAATESAEAASPTSGRGATVVSNTAAVGDTSAGKATAGETAGEETTGGGTSVPGEAGASARRVDDAARPAPTVVPEELGDPPVEDVEVTDLLLVVDLTDEVLVIDEHPRYHLAGCVHLTGRAAIPLPIDEARRDGFTPCAVCAPDRTLADRARARRAAGNS
jgi:hypothetical protein